MSERRAVEPIDIWTASIDGVFKDCGVINGEGVRCGYRFLFREGKGWFRTREEAVRQANVLVQKRIKSLEKQLTKLRSITYA
jgi:hypothetical protein